VILSPWNSRTLEADTVRWASVSTRLSLLVDLASLLSREVAMDRVLDLASERLAEALLAERATIWILDAQSHKLVSRAPLAENVGHVALDLGQGLVGSVAKDGRPLRVLDAQKDERFLKSIDAQTGFTTRSVIAVPIRSKSDSPLRGVVQVLNARAGAFSQDDERYLIALAAQLSLSLDLTSWSSEEHAPGFSLRGPINRIVGRGDALREVYDKIARAAPTTATVLLRGETGTGKGLFARAVHANSTRHASAFVTVDATTLPRELVESELFGHERGAFTGADRRVLGKVEAAHGGTLFLDEIGDLPLELQGKLLRFLQDKTFTRVGGREEHKVDARLIAATHRDLEALVREGKFREDLYYRLRVIEIPLPPLRVRGAQDVLELALHFAEEFARRYEKKRPTFAKDAEALLLGHTFPGNVRELEHWIESAIVLSDDGVLRASHFPKPQVGALRALEPAKSDALDDVIANHVRDVLERTQGNRTEAAKVLGISRNTLAKYVPKVEK
jgi:transcriptional regulator with GAF, ATPase, and Fis domain